MVGRGATRNPWIFGQIAALLSDGKMPLPTMEDRRRLILDHFRTVIGREDDKLARFKLATFTNWYSHGLPQGLRLRRQIHGMESSQAFIDAIEEHFDTLAMAEAA
jgi:tRNA-dihydrouridine synthase